MNSQQELTALKQEFARLFGHIQVIRKVAATLRQASSDDPDAFATMSDQLDAVVESTEEATNSIMTAMDEMVGLIKEMRAVVGGSEAKRILNGMADTTTKVFEACAFQDLTGQRVTRVVRSLKFVEERVNAIISMWGPDELKNVLVSLKKETKPGEVALAGPQRKGQALSQTLVDSLFTPAEAAAPDAKPVFNQNEIDKLFG